MNPMFSRLAKLAVAGALLVPAAGHADESIEVEMHSVSAQGVGDPIGRVVLEAHQHGVLIRPSLDHLEPGLHGFHLHQNASCEPAMKDGKKTAAAAAGGHYDPENTNVHRGPYDPSGHLGDLPALHANAQGAVSTPELAPRLEPADFAGRALIIHKGGDNYADEPEPLGGGGARVACGVIPAS